MRSALRTAFGRLHEPVSGSSLRALRLMLGLVMFGSLARLVALDWAQTLYVQPKFVFRYWLFDGLPRLPAPAVGGVIAVAAAGALTFAIGLRPRLSGGLFVLAFTWLQLVDVTNYLNHYYLVVLLAVLLVAMPLRRSDDTVPRWFLWLVRVQVAVVYVYAALAKAGPDWLIHAQPLSIWLYARTDFPVLGHLFGQPWFAHVASWFGFLFDLTIVGWLSWKRTRPFAYAVVLVFHAMTLVLFDIGVFPFLMSTAATVFFDPAWATRFRRGLPSVAFQGPHQVRIPLLAVAGGWALFQLLFPLRHLAIPGDVLWNEGGMRWSWKVMVREKQGSVTFHVKDPATGQQWQVSPNRYLLPRQESEMGGQPDLILQLAHYVARDFAEHGRPGVEVRAEAKVSLNGRPPANLIDPTVDLAKVEDSWAAPLSWVLAEPSGPPLVAISSPHP